MSGMTLKELRDAVTSGAVAIRGKAWLQPAGGPGDKVFPPTHSIDERSGRERGGKYAREDRRLVNGAIVHCVLLDSVQSQANRMEEALQALWAEKCIVLPVISVSFADVAPDVGVVTSLSAPHRIADALLRDSLLGGQLFRLSELGKSFTDSSVRNAAPIFRVCPTGLVFGLWDSTGPKGGLGAKFARALASEIVGFGVEPGVKTSSRIDPAGIVKDAGPVFVAKQRDAGGNLTWTDDVLQAEPLDPKKPPTSSAQVELVKKWGKKEKAGKPSSIVHGNIAPSIDDVAGGVTIDHAEQTVVLSLAALRRLSFGGGDVEARTALAALALLAVLAAAERGLDLRSRCFLVPQPDGALRLELVAGDGSCAPCELDLEGAVSLYRAAVDALPDSVAFKNQKRDGVLQPGETLAELQPSEKLKHLVIRSRELAATGVEIEEA